MNAINIMFEWLLAASLRASVLALAIIGIRFLFRRWLPAGWRHALWFPMLCVLVLPVLPTAPFGFSSLAAEKSVVMNPTVSHVATVERMSGEGSARLDKPATAIAKLNYLALLWFAGACGVLMAGAVGYRRNMTLVKRGSIPTERRLSTVIEEVAREAGLKFAPRVLVSEAVESPAVTGMLRPVLLLPAGFPEGFSATETRMILLHEFSHLKRFDLPLNWLACVLQALHWFNPLLWFAFAKMRADREFACDERVLSLDSTDCRAEYGEALLKLQRATSPRAMTVGFVGIFERGSEMKSRIREISMHRPGHFGGQAVGAAILAMLMIFGVTRAQEAAPKKASGYMVKSATPDVAPALSTKMQKIMIPAMIFTDVTIEDAVDFLRQRSAELDTGELDAAKKGVNFVIRRPRPVEDGKVAEKFPQISMSLKNVSLTKAISEVAEQAGYVYQIDNFAVTFIPKEEVAKNSDSAVPAVKTIVVKPRWVKGKAADEMNKIVIPQVKLEGVSLQEAVDFLK